MPPEEQVPASPPAPAEELPNEEHTELKALEGYVVGYQKNPEMFGIEDVLSQAKRVLDLRG